MKEESINGACVIGRHDKCPNEALGYVCTCSCHSQTRQCKLCGKEEDLRGNVCFDCATKAETRQVKDWEQEIPFKKIQALGYPDEGKQYGTIERGILIRFIAHLLASQWKEVLREIEEGRAKGFDPATTLHNIEAHLRADQSPSL